MCEGSTPDLGLGLCLGAAGIAVVNRVRLPRQRQLLVTAIMFLAVGLSRQLDISYLLVALITGAVIANFTPRFRRFFESLQAVDTPILVIFLTLAGANLHLEAVPSLGLLGAVYILARLSGKLLGSRLGDVSCRLLPAGCSNIAPAYRKHIGLTLTPQAGVAVGLALLAEERLPLPEGVVVTVILGSVIFFEIIGPILVVRALKETGSVATDES
jgi:Kef-type K+ transport system membrane component KefB